MMKSLSPQYDTRDVQVLSRQRVFQGFFSLSTVSLRHRLFSGDWGPVIEREVFEKAEAAGAVLYDPKHDLIGLVEQFRVGLLERSQQPWSFEGVAGMVEAEENPEAMLRRELVEEAGITAAELIHITSMYPTPGSCDEYTHIYLALCDLSAAGGQYGLPEEGEDILLHVLPADQVLDAMLQERTNNAATLIALLWLQIHRPRLRASTVLAP